MFYNCTLITINIMYLICFICLASYMEGNYYRVKCDCIVIYLLFNLFACTFFPDMLPKVLSSDVFSSYNLIRHIRNTQTQDFKPVPSTLTSVNNVQENNKSQIILLTANSTELDENLVSKEQYIFQKETGFYNKY